MDLSMDGNEVINIMVASKEFESAQYIRFNTY